MKEDNRGMIPGYPKGSDITLINTINYRVTKENGKSKEILDVIYRDNKTRKKNVYEFIDPLYTYWVAKEEYRVPYNRSFIKKDQAYPVDIEHRKLESDIAKAVGWQQWFYNNISIGNNSENRKIHTHPDIFMSDMNIEDFYRFKFSNDYLNDPVTLDKAYFDIEVDTKTMAGDFPEPGECPINAVTLLMPFAAKCFVFLLKTSENPLIDEFITAIKDKSVFSDLKNFLVDAIGGQSKVEKMGLDNINFQFMFYDEDKEIDLIADLFRAINFYTPDFVLAWNMAFDIPYIIERIRKLGYDITDIMCHPDFKNKVVQYFVDERNLNSAAERCDFAKISSYSVYTDQMIQFASRRKGQTKFTSYSLDSIGETVAKVRKLDYKHITTSLTELPYKDYRVFVFYNIMDTMVQACIEACTGDIDYLFAKCNDNNTRYSKGHRQTVFLYTKGAKEFWKDGFVIGNNVNKFNPKPTTKFPGAFVADPVKAGDKAKMKVYGSPISVYENLDDWDYASLYPSVIREFNIASNTQYGQLKLEEQINPVKENRFNDDKWTREAQFMEDFHSHDWLEIPTRWFGFPDYTTLYNIIEDLFTHEINPTYGLRKYNRDGTIDPMIFEQSHMSIQPMIFKSDNDRMYYDQTIYAHMEFDQRRIKEIQEHARSNQHY